MSMEDRLPSPIIYPTMVSFLPRAQAQRRPLPSQNRGSSPDSGCDTRSDPFLTLRSANTSGNNSTNPTPLGYHAASRSPMEDPKNPHHTDWDHNNDDFDLSLVIVTIHNLSQGGTILEQLDHFDENNWHHNMEAAELFNIVASRLSLYDHYWPSGANHMNVDDDDIISHTRSCYLGSNGQEGNGYITPEHSQDYFEYDYAAPYETSHQAWDRLLNHNDMLVDENWKLRH
jgi:hypothetical protein